MRHQRREARNVAAPGVSPHLIPDPAGHAPVARAGRAQSSAGFGNPSIAEQLGRAGIALELVREICAVFANYDFSSAKAERELGMRFRSVEQAYIDTLEAERSLARGGG